MTNNDVFKRIRFIEDFTNLQLIDVFNEVDFKVEQEVIKAWQKKEDQPEFKMITDVELALFLNGLINIKRGKKPGAKPPLETELENNDVLKKLKIAYQLTSDDILKLFKSKGKKVSKNELSAFLRNPDQAQYRVLQDQYLRNFMSALQVHLKK
ncbi:YehS family protein [Psychroflexus maritimus]|uniref:DUF1456 family protein n=1 Tax=Psychroflexus maritimus TaxID=2714865 RepID=A0A967AC71_9FLAO|nr:DUF1456 family protein [Psychroflexus maritimus]NGZ88928.1 DUF1456 family protein [Psychroflexus maritimus]